VQLDSLLHGAAARFEAAGIEQAAVDAELLLAHFLGCSRGELVAKIFMGEAATEQITAAFEALVSRREQREPLQHITGKAYFRNLELNVGRGVFVPRPETEMVAGLAIDALRAVATSESNEGGLIAAEPIAVDLGTGSGAIALSLATEVRHAKVWAVEKSSEAMPFTQRNFDAYGFGAQLIQGDLADAFQELNGKVSVVVSNPPYIPNKMIPRDIEVRLFDPELALYGGDDGMDVMHAVSISAKRLLFLGGTLVVEHADNQSQQVIDLLTNDGWRQVRAHRDLTGRERAVTAIRS
jgi:release factor glutamine methyltransferase